MTAINRIPKVTVIVPNFNHSRFLDMRINTVLQQRYQDFEVILMDDASTDSSVEIIKRYATHPNVREVLINEVNTGIPFKQWNKGIARARGEYIWIAESDDYADAGLLERLVPLLDLHPEVGVAYCQSWAVDPENKTLYSLENWTRDLSDTHWNSDYIADGPTECAHYVALKCTIPNASGAIFRRSAFERIGGADEDFRLSGDWMLWAKLMMVSNVAFVAEPLNYFRMHSNSVRSSSRRSAIALREAVRIFDHIAQRIAVPAAVREEACERLLSRWLLELSMGRLAIGANWELYSLVKKVDRKIGRRLVKRLVASLGRRLSNASRVSQQ